mgnify:CR=1 FL=1
MIRQIRNKVEITAALSLIWETFLQFEAPDYSDEGVKSFREFIEMDSEQLADGMRFTPMKFERYKDNGIQN